MKKLLMVICLLVAVSLSSCSSAFEKAEQPRLRHKGDKAIEYLEEKYGENFTPIIYGFGDYSSDTDTVECYPDWMDPEKEHITIFIHSNGTYGDNYFEYYIRENHEAYIKEQMEPELGPDIKLYQGCSNYEMSSELNKDSTIEDLYRVETNYIFSADAYVKCLDNISDEEVADKMASISDKLLKIGDSFLINVYFVSPEAYDSVSRFDASVVNDAYEKEFKPDGAIVKNLGKIRLTGGESY